jgi:RNA polymerase sigma-70 factor (ECF subfamily)
LTFRRFASQPGPVIELNRAAAVAMAEGPETGLALIDQIRPVGVLDGYQLLHASRADLLRRAGQRGEAAIAYRRALVLCTNPVEARYLRRRLRQVVVNEDG